MMKRWVMTGFGLGYAPVASGTFGSAGAIAIAMGLWTLVHLAGWPMAALDLTWTVLAVLATIGCGRWGVWAADHFAETAKKKGDPGEVVLDEFAGQWVALIALPMASTREMLAVMAVQFFLFRLFDVTKPPPGRRLEKLSGGWGIVADDIAAGIYANILGQVFFRFILS